MKCKWRELPSFLTTAAIDDVRVFILNDERVFILDDVKVFILDDERVFVLDDVKVFILGDVRSSSDQSDFASNCGRCGT